MTLTFTPTGLPEGENQGPLEAEARKFGHAVFTLMRGMSTVYGWEALEHPATYEALQALAEKVADEGEPVAGERYEVRHFEMSEPEAAFTLTLEP